MACTDGSCSTGTEITCGTGGWNGPKPGDPENIPSIRARGIVGAVEVSWFYPAINTHAVGHFRIYRNTTGEFSTAIERGIVSASIFIDQIPEEETREYFYWVRMVTANGTVMEPVGPASARPYKLSESLLEKLTEEIDEGMLAKSLRDRIDLIDGIQRDIAKETLDRINSNAVFADALSHVQTGADEMLTYVRNETIERRDADGALAQSIASLATGVDGNTAAIAEEKTSRTTADEALTREVQILYSNVQENTAAILHEQEARATDKEAIVSQLDALVVSNAANSAAIEAEQSTRITETSALTEQVTSLVSKTESTAAGLANEITARTNADNSLAEQIQTAQSVLGSNISSVQTTMQTQINATNGKVNNIGALWTAKVDVNGMVGGFGVYNNGAFVEAGFDVDRFWVGRTTNKVKPFIIDSGVVYIDQARIRSASIDTLRLAGNAVTVSKYGYGQVTQAGGYEFNNSSWVTIASISLSLSGMNALETAGTIILGTANVWEGGGGAVTFDLGLFVNETLISTSSISLGPSQSVTATGFTAKPNGTYSISLRAKVGSPYPNKLANVYGSIVLMSGKR